MLLTLIAEVADETGQAGPWVTAGCGERVLLRDWLGDALAQMGERDPRRQALIDRATADLQREGRLPANEALALLAINEEVATRVRATAKTNVSKAVSELVKAGLLRRHYRGYAVDHENRGGQRHAVYTLCGPARALIARSAPSPKASRHDARQPLLF